ncbi:ROK family transcriptional regulator [Tessaracoccus massiliensis]|uniref:ROK family transcriptional regulator n=1 Tax=Tessaracoccus massiliensis TaxID=1522311 RepID=UPI00058AF003|nr:ROK family transcriptional regulator [Tessaracoccus massiliensis]
MNRAFARRASTPDRLLSLLIAEGPQHRAALARELGISRSRVTDVVTDLLEGGAITEVHDAPGNRDGRAGPVLSVSPSLAPVIGIQVTTRRVEVHLASLSGETIAQRQADLEPGVATPEDVLLAISRMTRDACSFADIANLSAAGVGFFGRIDPVTHEVHTHPETRWSRVKIGDEVSSLLGIPVVVENNSRLEALAEAQWGAGRGHQSMLFLHASAGITATVVIDGEPLRGARGGAGELGHVSIDPAGPLCACGSRGCLSLYASSLVAQHELAVSDFDAALEQYTSGQPKAVRVFHEAADSIAKATSTLTLLIEPEVMVLGGDFSRAGEPFLQRLAQGHQDSLPHGTAPELLALAELRGAGSRGAEAAALMARKYIAQRLAAGEPLAQLNPKGAIA